MVSMFTRMSQSTLADPRLYSVAMMLKQRLQLFCVPNSLKTEITSTYRSFAGAFSDCEWTQVSMCCAYALRTFRHLEMSCGGPQAARGGMMSTFDYWRLRAQLEPVQMVSETYMLPMASQLIVCMGLTSVDAQLAVVQLATMSANLRALFNAGTLSLVDLAEGVEENVCLRFAAALPLGVLVIRWLATIMTSAAVIERFFA